MSSSPSVNPSRDWSKLGQIRKIDCQVPIKIFRRQKRQFRANREKICSLGGSSPSANAFYVFIFKCKPLSAALRPLRGKGVDTLRFRQNGLAKRGMNRMWSSLKVFLPGFLIQPFMDFRKLPFFCSCSRCLKFF